MSAVYTARQGGVLGGVQGAVARRLPCKAPQLWPDLGATPFTDVAVSGVIGQGCRCTVFAAAHRGRQVVLKIYHSQAVAKHARRSGGSLARYEYQRNLALRGVSQLTRHIADPIGCISSPRCELFVQERVFGEPLDAFLSTCSASNCAFVLGEVRLIAERAHAAGLFDLDLHARNILVRRIPSAAPRPVLFDFNKAPYHLQPPNPLCALLLKVGMLTPASRDWRCLRRLQRLSGALPMNCRRV